MAVRTSHVFKVARRRAQQFARVWPVRTALFSDGWVAFGIASMYESLMEDTLIVTISASRLELELRLSD
ncbi:MAG: hypothetical protein DMF44_15335 [Verrucomicrobia bacterium]|nr:MAG: hypothetical protein DMF44_15335 [Verrucomicrobiota bacterium]